MKRILLLMALGMLAFTACTDDKPGKDPNGNTDDTATKTTLDVKIKTGETYRIKEGVFLTTTVAPNDFVATMNNIEIRGVHAGKTKIVAIADGHTYTYNVEVTAANTLYVDMAIYLGQSKESIIKLYGEPTHTEGSSSLFGPLNSLSPETGNIFTFDANNKVIACNVYFPLSSGLAIVAHLKDRYEIFTNEDNTSMMGDAMDITKCNVILLYDYSESPLSVFYTTKAELDKQTQKSRGLTSPSQSTVELDAMQALSHMAKGLVR